jgi:hypothetical protein
VLPGPAYKAGLAQHLPVKANMYAAMTKDAAQRRSWTFYEAIKIELKSFGYGCLS